MNKQKSCDEVTWYDYIKSIKILEKYINNFSYVNKILSKRLINQMLQKLYK